MSGAISIFALVTATDEEYATGLAHKDPQAILTGEKKPPTRKPRKRPARRKR